MARVKEGESKGTANRGFASMSAEQQKAIARKGAKRLAETVNIWLR